jgi:hypothetical protein
MGYNCAAAINLKVDGIESQILTKEKTEFLKNELASLRSRQVLVKKVNHNKNFFDSLVYYLSFTSDENKISEHSKLGTLFPYGGDYQLEEYIFDDEVYVGSPIEILELYILCFTISRKFPESKIELGMGDAGFFWSDIELKNGEIVKISSEYGGDDGDGFICNKFEIRQLFLGLNYLWLEDNNTIKEDLENYFHQKNNEIFLAELENNLFLNEDTYSLSDSPINSDDILEDDANEILKINRDPNERKDVANVFWNKQYTLFDLSTDEPIFPDLVNGQYIYKIYYSSNEDPSPHYGEFNEQELEDHIFYKFKNKSNCLMFCNTKNK